MGKMDTINHPKIDPAVLPAAHCAASRKKSRKPRIFSFLLIIELSCTSIYVLIETKFL